MMKKISQPTLISTLKKWLREGKHHSHMLKTRRMECFIINYPLTLSLFEKLRGNQSSLQHSFQAKETQLSSQTSTTSNPLPKNEGTKPSDNLNITCHFRTPCCEAHEEECNCFQLPVEAKHSSVPL